MANIPEKHKQYNLLLYCVKNNKDCCEYESRLLSKLEDLTGHAYNLTPYGIDSIDAYLMEIDEVLKAFPDNDAVKNAIQIYKENILDLNDKNYWSVLCYIYEDYDGCTGLTHGKYYYWPCSKTKIEFRGVVDNEEFTAYQYPVNAEYWEVLDDPTGMAEYTIKNPPKRRFTSIEQQRASMEVIAKQVNEGIVE